MAAITLCSMPLRAASLALESFSGGVNATSASDQLYGWRFNVLSPISVTQLGVQDVGSNGLAISHDVGIFRVSDHALLTSAIVPAGTGGSLVSGFRYVTLGSSLALPVDTYVIVMTMPARNPDLQSINNTSFRTAPEIAWVTSEFDASSVLAYPNPALEGSFNIGMFGPNFQFAGADPVPEPTSLTLAALGSLGLLGYGWRQKRAA
jgi:PEP-CTERM motif